MIQLEEDGIRLVDLPEEEAEAAPIPPMRQRKF